MRKLPDLISSYLTYTKDLEAPEVFHLSSAIWMISSALRRRVHLDMGHFSYSPNQYMVLVAPPGIIAKSTTINVAVKLLREVQGITFGPDSLTWQAFIETLLSAQREDVLGDPKSLDCHRIMNACMTVAISEFGTFLDKNEDQLPNLLIAFWDGQEGVFSRATRKDGTSDIINPLVNMIGCTTSAWMKDNFRANLLEGGLGSRILFIFAEKKRKLVPYPHLIHNEVEQSKIKFQLIHDLIEISKLHGKMRLTDEALEFGKDFYHRHNTTAPSKNYFDGYHTRKFVHIHKLAMVFSVAERSDLVITATHLERSLAYLEAIEEGIAEITATIKSNATVQGQKVVHVRTILRAQKEVTSQKLTRLLMTQLSSRELDAVLDDMIRAGDVTKMTEKGKASYTWKGD